MSRFEPSIFKAYDIRGLYPKQMSEEVAYAVGQAFVAVTGAKRVVVGRDVRSSGPSLQAAAIKGITEAGADAIDIGVISTEMLYFAAGTVDCDGGLSITASHNPAEWNGVKFIGKGAQAMSRDGVLGELYDYIESNQPPLQSSTVGKVEEMDLLPKYVEYLQRYIPKDLPEMSLVANVNFGANGKIVDLLVKDLPLTLKRLDWEEDGSFPKGPPNPYLPKNRIEIAEEIREEQADFGVAWDADADRCFLFDEQGRFFHCYYAIYLLIGQFLKEVPGSTIIVEPRLTWASIAATEENGGKISFCRVGHTYIKHAMREHDAVFAGESSGHLYYRDFFYCDNGLISFLLMLGIFGAEKKKGRKVSELLDELMEKFPIILEELNYVTTQAKEIIEEAAEKYSDATQDRLDGISIEYPTWRFNLRMSNTEPILRICLEARSTEELAKRKEELMNWIKEKGATLQDDSH